MRRLLFIASLFFPLSFSSYAQANVVDHSLDGSSIDYAYKDLGPVQVDLSDGQFRWHWANISNGTGSTPYHARKIGDKMYLANFEVAGSSNFVTIVFDFGKKVFYTSAILGPKTPKEQALFETGPITQSTLKEN